MNKFFLLLPASAAALFLSGCVDEPEPYQGRVAPAYYGRPAYVDNGPDYGPDYGPDSGPDYGPDYGSDVDFYFVGGRPYSRFYGPLVIQDNRYYYRRGGAVVGYDADYGRRHSYRHGGPGYAGHGSPRGGYPPSHGGYTPNHGGGYTPGHGSYGTNGTNRGNYPNHGGAPVRTPSGQIARGQGGAARAYYGNARGQGGQPQRPGGPAPQGGQRGNGQKKKDDNNNNR